MDFDLHYRTYGLRNPSGDNQLKKRELEVLYLASFGLNVTQIADEMNLSYHTINGYLKTARFRLRASNTTHAVAIAIRLGYFQ